LDVVPEHAEGDGGEALRTLGSRIRELEQEVERLNSAVHEEQMLRIREQATLQRDKSSFEARTKLALFLDLLAVVDSFDQLVKHGEGSQDDSSLLVGSQAVLGQLNQFLARNGVHKLEGLEGSAYDSATSEIARVVTDSGAPANTVVRVLRDGYKLGEMLLRPAMVDVASEPPATVGSNDDGED
jgi:molecular chaperone GrpE